MATMSERDRWGSDVPISKPMPTSNMGNTVSKDLGGLAFGPMGLFFPLGEALSEERYTPVWGPRLDDLSRRENEHG